MLFEPYLNLLYFFFFFIIVLVKFGLQSGRLLGNSCSLGLRYVLKYKYLIVTLFSRLGLGV